MELKKPKTFAEQVEILRGRGCVILDSTGAEEFLSRVSYYHFTGYFLPFKRDAQNYISGLTFERVVRVYEFDQILHNILFGAIGELEIEIKTAVAYYHAHKYGEVGYLNQDNYSEHHKHDVFKRSFDIQIQHNEKMLIVKHHIDKYDGVFPIWVAVELFTIGMISFFYADLPNEDKQAVASQYETSWDYMETWLHALTILRNTSAHYGRLYAVSFNKNPKLPKVFNQAENPNGRTLFKQLYMLKLLYVRNKAKWNNNIMQQLSALIAKYEDDIEFKHIGFPVDWEAALRWECD